MKYHTLREAQHRYENLLPEDSRRNEWREYLAGLSLGNLLDLGEKESGFTGKLVKEDPDWKSELSLREQTEKHR